ncbi:hypothetical protein JYT91_00355 [archaeon AH-315-M20]|nr:hypothetical protein [archaeon AH-315-M20]
MYIIKILRHGPKNDQSQKGADLSKVLLDPNRVDEIRDYARSQVNLVKHAMIEIETTPVDRAIATGRISYDVIKQSLGIIVTEPKINELIGQFAFGENNKAINLCTNKMSFLWNEGKKVHRYGDSDAEHQSLYNWCEVGFDNLPKKDENDIGITIREMAWRIGSYAYRKLKGYSGGDKVTLAFGHSSSIESLLYLCLEMVDGKDGSDPESMLTRFNETGGALHPLTGIVFKYDKNTGLYLEYLIGKPETILGTKTIPFNIDTLRQMDNLFRTEGKSEEVTKKKLA